MAKFLPKRVALAQHFLHRPELARTLVGASAITPSDTVLEIGAGEGLLTAALAAVAGRVVAIEKDPVLVGRLRRRFQDASHVEIIGGDFLTTPLALGEYKLLANIPFNHTAQIMRKVVADPPRTAHLILQREAAQKFAGQPAESQASVLIKPWFEIDIIRSLRRTDFVPPPSVESVLLQMKKRGPPLVSQAEAERYRRFVSYGFRRYRPFLRLSFESIFTHKQWKRLARDLRFNPNATPTQLTFAQWLGLFNWFRHSASPAKQRLFDLACEHRDS
jgi:23S rRNA (adenine-N6)-dimethyltransferase